MEIKFQQMTVHKIYQMAIGIDNTYTNILHSKAHQDVPESEFLV
jgi:hypothetical protein